MNIVSPVGLNSGGGAASRLPATYETGRSAPSFGATGAQSTATTSAVTQIHSAVSQMLQAVGGGVQNDKMLQMLIALMILFALLNDMQKPDTGARDAMAELGSRGGPQQQFVSGYSSSTTISFEYTSTTVMFGSSEAYSSGTDAQLASPGGEVDLKA